MYSETLEILEHKSFEFTILFRFSNKTVFWLLFPSFTKYPVWFFVLVLCFCQHKDYCKVIFHSFQGSIEEKIYQRQISKQGLSGTVIDFKPSEIQFSQEDLKDLFSFNTSTECDTHSLLDCLCKGEGSTLRDNMNTVQISSEHQQKHLSGTSAELYMVSGVQVHSDSSINM